MDSEITQHKRMAMGKDMDGDYSCESGFKGVALHGGEELSKKMHLKDNKRGHRHLGRVADHGEHGMNTSIHGDSDSQR